MRKFCVNCGEKIDITMRYCPKCGHDIESGYFSEQTHTQRSQSRNYLRSNDSRNIYKIGRISIAFGIIGICLFFIYCLGIISTILGVIGLRNDKNPELAIIGLILGILSLFCYPMFYFIAPIVLSP